MGVFAQSGVTSALCLAALGLTIGFLLMHSSRHFNRKIGTQSVRSPVESASPPSQGHHLGAPQSLVQWEVQMHEVSRDLSAQLDTKMGLLQQLIGEADRAAARLEAALAASGCASQPAQTGPSAQAPSLSERDRPGWANRVASQAEALKSAGAVAHGVSSGEATNAEPPASTSGRATSERCYQEIYTLADYGFDAAEISRRVGTPVGEVELILGLRRDR